MKHRALRRFYHYWIARGVVTRSPVPTIVPPVAGTFVPHIYTHEELQRLLDRVDTHQARAGCTIAAPTFRAFLLLLYGAGLRLSEAVGLQRHDVDLRDGMVLIRETKFYKSRQLPIGPTLTRVLAESLEVARTTRPISGAAFFVNRRGAPMPSQTAYGTFASLRASIGVSGRLHDLRHYAASRPMPSHGGRVRADRVIVGIRKNSGSLCSA